MTGNLKINPNLNLSVVAWGEFRNKEDYLNSLQTKQYSNIGNKTLTSVVCRDDGCLVVGFENKSWLINPWSYVILSNGYIIDGAKATGYAFPPTLYGYSYKTPLYEKFCKDLQDVLLGKLEEVIEAEDILEPIF